MAEAATTIEIRFGGAGGQGVVTLGEILGAAAAHSGYYSAASTVYGSQARGGSTKADVILSSQPIDYPYVERPRYLVVLSQDAYDAYAKDEGGAQVIFYDPFFVTKLEPLPDVVQHAVPATALALAELQQRQPANFIMLGALAGVLKLFPPAAILPAMREQVRERFWSLNEQAFHRGLEISREFSSGRP